MVFVESLLERHGASNPCSFCQDPCAIRCSLTFHKSYLEDAVVGKDVDNIGAIRVPNQLFDRGDPGLGMNDVAFFAKLLCNRALEKLV